MTTADKRDEPALKQVGKLEQASREMEADAEREDAAAMAKHDAEKREIAEAQSDEMKQAATEFGLGASEGEAR